MKNLRGRVAVVTGAGSGLGRSLALRLASEGCHVALADVNRLGLAETATLLEERRAEITSHVVDVADRKQVHEMAADVLAQHGRVDIVVNNAGVALVESIAELSYEDFEWLWGINFWGVVYGTKAFLPHFLERGEGHIVNVSSLGGFITTPQLGPYCASKFAVRGFTETLYQEVSRLGVGVTSVHPGGVMTGLARNTRFGNTGAFAPDVLSTNMERFALTSPDRAAQRIIRAIKRNRLRLVIGADAHFLYALTKLAPIQAIKVAAHISNRMLTAVSQGKEAVDPGVQGEGE